MKQIENKYPVQNSIVHTETEDEAYKYKIFKIVCCERRGTASAIVETLELEKEYVLQFLIELEQVDRLVGHFAGIEEDDYSVEWYRK